MNINDELLFCPDAETHKLMIPKLVALVRICGLTFEITDNMRYEIPTEEQRENLKKTFGIEVELINED